MSRAQRLLALQEIDLLRDRTRSRLAKVTAALGDDRAVSEAERALVETERALAEIEPRLRAVSRDREGARAHLDREQAKLYSGSVRAPKELQNIQRETEALKRQLAVFEESVLELMLARDDADSAVREARTALEDARSRAEAGSRALRAEHSRLAAELEQLEQRRARAIGNVPAADLDGYERLRGAKGGQAVSRLKSGECDACGMQLARQQADQVASTHGLVHCPGCGRILAV